MTDLIGGLIALCGGDGAHPALRAGVGAVGMFALGAAGSAAHCGPMCGPIVAGQVADRLACLSARRMTEAHRVRTGLLLPYHAGRLTTYAALGAIAGATGFSMLRQAESLRGMLLLVAALMLLATAWRVHPAFRATLPLPAPLLHLARRLDRTRAPGAYMFGMLLGLLPCGLLYAALVSASVTASPLGGAAAMMAFGLGTMPLLVGIGILGGAGRGWMARLAPYLVTVNAAVLVGTAIKGSVLF